MDVSGDETGKSLSILRGIQSQIEGDIPQIDMAILTETERRARALAMLEQVKNEIARLMVGRIVLVLIVNGEDVEIETSLTAPMEFVRDAALLATKNTGRRLHEWEIRDSKGRLIFAETTVRDLGFKPLERLFLTLCVGAGG